MSSICHIQRDAGQAYAVRYGDHTFRFRLGVLNAAQKAAIHVHPDSDLEVEAPAGAPLTELKAAVQRRARWVLKHLDEIEARRRSAQSRQWVSGESLPWVNATPPWWLREMQAQWGSCSLEGVIILNPHLVKAPTHAVDYVILHELCHLAEHNHSPRFYRLLDDHMPDWRTVKQRLDEQVEVVLG